MKTVSSETRRRAMRMYFAAQALVVGSAAAMSWTHSYLPMALGGSAALMLTMPLVRDIAVRQRVRR